METIYIIFIIIIIIVILLSVGISVSFLFNKKKQTNIVAENEKSNSTKLKNNSTNLKNYSNISTNLNKSVNSQNKQVDVSTENINTMSVESRIVASNNSTFNAGYKRNMLASEHVSFVASFSSTHNISLKEQENILNNASQMLDTYNNNYDNNYYYYNYYNNDNNDNNDGILQNSDDVLNKSNLF